MRTLPITKRYEERGTRRITVTHDQLDEQAELMATHRRLEFDRLELQDQLWLNEQSILELHRAALNFRGRVTDHALIDAYQEEVAERYETSLNIRRNLADLDQRIADVSQQIKTFIANSRPGEPIALPDTESPAAADLIDEELALS